MLKIVTLIKRKSGISHEEFRACYENNFSHLVSHISRYVVDFRRTYPIQADSSPASEWVNNNQKAANRAGAPFDCMTELWVENSDTMTKMYETLNLPHIKEIMVSGRQRFMDESSIVAVVCEEVISKLK
jgi:EthD domain